jgi:signal transduction histidine kinase
MNVYPEYPPRVRVEWLMAGTRVALAGGALLATIIDPLSYNPYQVVTSLIATYFAYSLAMLALVWAPVRFARGWRVAVHTVDFAIFSVLMVVTEGATSPFFVYYTFLLICATLRWQKRGTVFMGGVTIVAYAAICIYASKALHSPAFALDTFVIRTVYLVVITTLLGYFAAHQQQFQHEIVRLAAWPRRISRDPRDVISEVIAQSSMLLQAPRIVLAWEEPRSRRLNLAWRTNEEVMWADEPEGSYGSLVLPALERRSFQAADATSEHGRVVALTENGFRYRECHPLDEGLRARFDVRAVQSWPLEGELIQGRLFALDKQRMQIDELVIGELVARLAVSRLDSLYFLQRLGETAALEERVRVARELHDSILQSQAGAALQLLAARRLLERDSRAGKERLAEVQEHFERGELEMRSFIRRLRPADPSPANPTSPRLSDRLEELRRRVARQWDIKVVIQLHAADGLPPELSDSVYRLVQEGVVNAARHADASVIEIDLTVDDRAVRLRILDDGRGFPFHGTYDLAALATMKRGPRTLKERVGELRGDLMLRSQDTGTELLITLPFAAVLR